MGNFSKRSAGHAAIGLFMAALASIAVASPPPSRGPTFRETHTFRESHVESHLDLRPPTSAVAVAVDKSNMAETAMPFPSMRHPPEGMAGYGQEDQNQASRFGAAAPSGRVMGRTEELVRRVHQEGLPVARLWESHSALVSLGLNQKGKPGLWLIQKVH
jgi:hypothetical protein